MQIEGGCHCGNITYEADIDPETVGICHGRVRSLIVTTKITKATKKDRAKTVKGCGNRGLQVVLSWENTKGEPTTRP